MPPRRLRVAVPGLELVAGLEEHLAGHRHGAGHVLGILEPVLHVQAHAVVRKRITLHKVFLRSAGRAPVQAPHGFLEVAGVDYQHAVLEPADGMAHVAGLHIVRVPGHSKVNHAPPVELLVPDVQFVLTHAAELYRIHRQNGAGQRFGNAVQRRIVVGVVLVQHRLCVRSQRQAVRPESGRNVAAGKVRLPDAGEIRGSAHRRVGRLERARRESGRPVGRAIGPGDDIHEQRAAIRVAMGKAPHGDPVPGQEGIGAPAHAAHRGYRVGFQQPLPGFSRCRVRGLERQVDVGIVVGVLRDRALKFHRRIHDEVRARVVRLGYRRQPGSERGAGSSERGPDGGRGQKDRCAGKVSCADFHSDARRDGSIIATIAKPPRRHGSVLRDGDCGL